jgi:hypothetical protein
MHFAAKIPKQHQLVLRIRSILEKPIYLTTFQITALIKHHPASSTSISNTALF